jgi:ubiquinone/menaquinone biosynthesis C-methylase UbiE
MMTARNTEDAFRNVDEAADPQALIAYLDAVAKDGGLGATFKQRGIAELRLQPGMAVLDAGCGTGQDVLAFAAAVGPVGRAVGVDGSATMIAEARTRAATAGVRAEFEVADVVALPFPDATFDVCHTERVLNHVADVPAALAELRRVTRPGGRIVCCEMDLGGRVMDVPDRDVYRAMNVYGADHLIRNGWLGRQMPRLLMEAGLVAIEVVPVASVFRHAPPALPGAVPPAEQAARVGAITHDQAAAMQAYLLDADAAGTFFSAFHDFVFSGCVPAL